MQRLQHGPWVGVRNVSDPFEEAPTLLYDAVNCYIPDPAHGSGVSQRPPVTVAQPGGVIGGAGRYGQRIYDHTRLDGTIDRFVFCAGKMYRYDGNVTTAGLVDITPANVSIATTGRIYCTALADRLIVTDGVNPPWTYDPATSTAAYITQGPLVTLLSIGTPNTTLAVAQFGYAAGTTVAVKLATASLAFPASSITTLSTWGIYRVTINSAGTLIVTAASATMSYATEALAIAALPTVAANQFDAGYVTIQANTAGAWTAGTTTLIANNAVGAAQAVNYYAPRVRQFFVYGQPVVYAAKLFFILGASDGVAGRTGIIWSEENQPTVGYQQLNYANYWQLAQTAQDPLFALAATNVALYYFRQRSIGAISGAVSPTFQTTSTQDAISTTLGTTTPASVLVAENFIWFVNEDGLPHRFAIGSRTIEQLWLNMRDASQTALATATVQTSHPTTCIAAYQPELRLVVMTIWPPSATIADTATTVYVFSATTGQYQGRWLIGAGAGMDTLGVCRDNMGRSMLMALGATDTSTAGQELATRGALFVQRRTGDMSATVPWTDIGATALASTITTGELLGDAQIDKAFDIVALRVRASATSLVNTTRNMTVTYQTPRTASGGPLIGAISQSAAEDRKMIVGTAATGRWAKFTFAGPSGATLGTEAGVPLVLESLVTTLAADTPLIGPFTIEGLTVDAYPIGDDPLQY